MDRFVRLFEEKKLKSIELYRSETLGEDREEVWCNINLADILIHRVDIYRKGCIIELLTDTPEAMQACLSSDGELSYKIEPYANSRKLYERLVLNKNDVLNLLNGISLLFFAKSSCQTDDELKYCFSSSTLYPTNDNQDLNYNSITIKYSDDTGETLDIQANSVIRWSLARDLSSLPAIKKYFIGPQALKKITLENLSPNERSEIGLFLCIVNDPVEAQYIESHLYRDENGDVLYPNDSHTALEKLLAY